MKLNNKVKEKDERIKLLENSINSCQAYNTPTAQPAQKEIIEIENICKEVKRQLRLKNKLYVTNAKDEQQIKDLLYLILGRPAKIDNVRKIESNENVGMGKNSPFLVELINEDEKHKIMKDKYDYCKGKGIKIGLRYAKTPNQRLAENEKSILL